MDKDLTILFLGARRCGKTSVLSAMTTLLSNASGAISVKGDDFSSRKMRSSVEKMREIFSDENLSNGFWLDDEEGTYDINQYKFTVDVHDPAAVRIYNVAPSVFSFGMTCIDIPGEVLKNTSDEWSTKYGIVTEYINTADVLIIAIDSPQLVENGKQGAVKNCTETITETIISSLPENIADVDKLVIYVPVKCEKYFHSQGGFTINSVNDKIKKRFKDLIDFLHRNTRCRQVIVPVLTLGDLEFKCFNKTEGTEKSYFEYTGNKKYSPLYCEQPLLYSIEYFLSLVSNKNGRVNKLLK